MENFVSPEDIESYINSRDEFLKAVSENYCRFCSDPRKEKNKIDYENPLNCECRCDRVEKLLDISSDLNTAIKYFSYK